MVSIVRRELTTSSSSMISAHCSSKGRNQMIQGSHKFMCSFIRNVAVHHVAESTELGYHSSWGDSLSSKGCEEHDRGCEKALQHNHRNSEAPHATPLLTLSFQLASLIGKANTLAKFPPLNVFTLCSFPDLYAHSLAYITQIHGHLIDSSRPLWHPQRTRQVRSCKHLHSSSHRAFR